MDCAKAEAKRTCWFIAFSTNASTQGVEFSPTRVTSPGDNFSYFLHTAGAYLEPDLSAIRCLVGASIDTSIKDGQNLFKYFI